MKFRNLYLSACTTLSLFATSALAQEDPFQIATEKGEDLTEMLQGPWAVAFFSVIIAGAGFLCAMGKLSKETAAKIIGGAILVGSATYIAGFFVG